MVVFASSVYQAANTSTCRTRIVRVDPRTPVPPDVQPYPDSIQNSSLCCGGQYAHWKSCRDYCAGSTNEQRASWNYVTADVLVSMRNVIVDPKMNEHGLCGPMTLDGECVLNAMHWDSRQACTAVTRKGVRSWISKLGIVSTVYADAPGHFPQETVPSWLRLLSAMPGYVQLWTPNNTIARRYALYIGSALGISSERFVHLNGPISVSELYLYRPSPRYSGEPHKRPLTVRSRDDFRLMRQALRPNGHPGHRTLLFVRREQSRALSNHFDAEAALLRVARECGIRLEVRALGRGPLADDAAAFRAARVVVGVHGAGMANIVFCSDDASVVEIGYTNGMAMPEIYFDQARFLGLRYWAVVGRGSYQGQVTVDIHTLSNTVSRAMEGVQV